MKIHCFHDNVGWDSVNGPLIILWQERWRQQGWEPVVLNYDDARKHPDFTTLATAFEKLPTVNNRGYEQACFNRWLAMEVVGGGWMSDYDVMPYDFPPRDWPAEFTVWQGFGNPCPCLCSGSAADYEKFARVFAAWEPTPLDQSHRGGVHTSDQNILQQLPAGSFARGTECVQYKDEGWQTAPVVHYPGGVMADKKPKFAWIPRLR